MLIPLNNHIIVEPVSDLSGLPSQALVVSLDAEYEGSQIGKVVDSSNRGPNYSIPAGTFVQYRKRSLSHYAGCIFIGGQLRLTIHEDDVIAYFTEDKSC